MNEIVVAVLALACDLPRMTSAAVVWLLDAGRAQHE
jgi:hypothetical protein